MNAWRERREKKNTPLNTSGAAMMFDCRSRACLEQDHFFPPVDDYKRRFHSAHPREAHIYSALAACVFVCAYKEAWPIMNPNLKL